MSARVWAAIAAGVLLVSGLAVLTLRSDDGAPGVDASASPDPARNAAEVLPLAAQVPERIDELDRALANGEAEQVRAASTDLRAVVAPLLAPRVGTTEAYARAASHVRAANSLVERSVREVVRCEGACTRERRAARQALSRLRRAVTVLTVRVEQDAGR